MLVLMWSFVIVARSSTATAQMIFVPVPIMNTSSDAEKTLSLDGQLSDGRSSVACPIVLQILKQVIDGETPVMYTRADV